MCGVLPGYSVGTMVRNKKDFLFQRMSLAEQRINSMKLIPAADKNTAEFQTFVKIVV